MNNSPFGDFLGPPQEDFSGDVPRRSPFGLSGTEPTTSMSDADVDAYFTQNDTVNHHDPYSAPAPAPGRSIALSATMSWVLAIAGLFGVVSGLLFGKPVNSTGNMAVLGFSAIMLLLGGYGVVAGWSEMSSRARRFGFAVLAIVSGVFLIGLVQQNTVDGNPVLKYTSKNSDADFNEQLLEAMDLIQVVDNAIKSDPVILRAKQSETKFIYDEAIQLSADLAAMDNPAFGDLTLQVSYTVASAANALDKTNAAVLQSQQGRSEEADAAYTEFLEVLSITLGTFENALETGEYPVSTVRPWMQDLFDMEQK